MWVIKHLHECILGTGDTNMYANIKEEYYTSEEMLILNACAIVIAIAKQYCNRNESMKKHLPTFKQIHNLSLTFSHQNVIGKANSK